ncbi:protein insensitive-like [Zeugodacus cucurbitae]|uniref:protein insensitive-like n=1 Tax=Zeugodacus cucurbitae TaxID=28588 RepID=UPI0023D92594|nr:protein insensitive-like [Zeugodacus cucurbitae]
MSNIWILNYLFHSTETEFTALQRFLDNQQTLPMDLETNEEALDLSMAPRINMEQDEHEQDINNSSVQHESSEDSSTDSESSADYSTDSESELEQMQMLFQEPVVPEITFENTEEKENIPEEEADESQAIQIGPNGTTISANDCKKVRWTNASIATRTLLEVVFDRQTLATHTLSGKPSPAFLHLGRPVKRQLNPKKVEDIICYVRAVFNCSVKEIRMSITMKCADIARSAKRMRNRRN